jgi:hypothetical protein
VGVARLSRNFGKERAMLEAWRAGAELPTPGFLDYFLLGRSLRRRVNFASRFGHNLKYRPPMLRRYRQIIDIDLTYRKNGQNEAGRHIQEDAMTHLWSGSALLELLLLLWTWR